jgi:hypothetical protein
MRGTRSAVASRNDSRRGLPSDSSPFDAATSNGLGIEVDPRLRPADGSTVRRSGRLPAGGLAAGRGIPSRAGIRQRLSEMPGRKCCPLA